MKIHQECTNEWKPWFAWKPVRLQDGRLIWLETVQRKWHHENHDSWIIYRQPIK